MKFVFKEIIRFPVCHPQPFNQHQFWLKIIISIIPEMLILFKYANASKNLSSKYIHRALLVLLFLIRVSDGEDSEIGLYLAAIHCDLTTALD